MFRQVFLIRLTLARLKNTGNYADDMATVDEASQEGTDNTLGCISQQYLLTALAGF